jgi:hypothetical protein
MYTMQVITLTWLLFLPIRFWGPDHWQIPSAVGYIFTLLFYIGDGWLWYWVVSRHKDYLTSFFTGTSGFRFLMALAVLGIYYWATKGADMITFLWVFMVYYMVLLIHHSIYFSRMSKRV